MTLLGPSHVSTHLAHSTRPLEGQQTKTQAPGEGGESHGDRDGDRGSWLGHQRQLAGPPEA